jgi:MFS family permease
MMLAGIPGSAVGIYGFYAMQPYLLQLYGRRDYSIAGLAAALVAATQIAGGLAVPLVRKAFPNRISALLMGTAASAAALLAMGLSRSFWVVLAVLAAWAMIFSAAMPIRQAFLNERIPSAQRATVLSSDNLLGSLGAALSQPALGRAADAWGYPASYVAAACVELLAWPFLLLAGRRPRSAGPALDVRPAGP